MDALKSYRSMKIYIASYIVYSLHCLVFTFINDIEQCLSYTAGKIQSPVFHFLLLLKGQISLNTPKTVFQVIRR